MFSTREGKKCGRGKALGKPGFPGTDRDEDDEEDEEEEEGFDEDFMKQMDALKRACQMHVSVTCCCCFFPFFFYLFLLFLFIELSDGGLTQVLLVTLYLLNCWNLLIGFFCIGVCWQQELVVLITGVQILCGQ